MMRRIEELNKEIEENKRYLAQLEAEKEAALKAQPMERIKPKQAKMIVKKYLMPALKEGIADTNCKPDTTLYDVLLMSSPSVALEFLTMLSEHVCGNADSYFTLAYQINEEAKKVIHDARMTAGALKTGVYEIPSEPEPLSKTKIESNQFVEAICKYGVAKMRTFRNEELSAVLLNEKQKINRQATVERLKKAKNA